MTLHVSVLILVTMSDVLNQYEKYVLAVNSKATACHYKKGAKSFLTFCAEQNVQLQNAHPGLMIDYVQYLRENGKSARSVHFYKISANMFVLWLRSKGYKIPEFIPAKLPKIKASSAFALTEDELKVFLKSCDKINDPNKTILKLLPMTGLRVSEICSLMYGNVKRIENAGLCLMFYGKGDKQREVPLMEDARNILRVYMDSNSEGKKPDEFIFPSKTSKSGYINITTIEQSCKKIAKEIGIPLLTPHKLRHTFATLLVRGGVDMKTLQLLLGHSQLATTSIYMHPDKRDMRSAVDNAQKLLRESHGNRNPEPDQSRD